MKAIFSKLKDIVGLGDPVEYEYEYDEVGGSDYQNMYRDNQGITPAVSATSEATSSPRRSRSPLAQTSTTAGVTSRRSEEHTSELQSLTNLVCRLLLEKKKQN